MSKDGLASWEGADKNQEDRKVAVPVAGLCCGLHMHNAQ